MVDRQEVTTVRATSPPDNDASSANKLCSPSQDQFLRAAPVSGGVGEFLMRKMGWRTGEGLGRNREGTVEPIIIDFKVDRKGQRGTEQH